MTPVPALRHVAFLVLVIGCSPEDDPSRHLSAEPESIAAPPDRIDLPAMVRSNLGITFARVEARRVAQTLRVPGSFELQPLARHEYGMSLPGRVELLADQYQKVEPGQPLFRFQSSSWPALLHEVISGEQDIATTLSEIEVGKARQVEARRKLELARGRIQSLARADFKRADLEAEAAELEASLPRLLAELRLAETRNANARRTREHALHRASAASGIPESELVKEIVVGDTTVPTYSTIDWIVVHALEPGMVEALAITDGAYVEPPATILSTVDPRRVRFRALALQADLPRLITATTARIVPPRSPGIAIEEGVQASLTLGLEAHPEERTMTLLATPEELAPWIRPGVSAFLEVEVDASAAPELAIPRSAIVQDGLTHVFFRRDPAHPDRVIRVEADMGISDGVWVVIQSGLMRDDEVVLEGAYELKLATESSGAPQAQGHFHADGSFHGEK